MSDSATSCSLGELDNFAQQLADEISNQIKGSQEERRSAQGTLRNENDLRPTGWSPERKGEDEEMTEDEVAAAETIQRYFRVYQANKEVNIRKEENQTQPPPLSDPKLSKEVIVHALRYADVPLSDSPPSSIWDAPSVGSNRSAGGVEKASTESSPEGAKSTETGSAGAAYDTSSLAALRQTWENEWQTEADKTQQQAAARNEKLQQLKQGHNKALDAQRSLWEKEWLFDQQREDETKRNADWLKEKQKLEARTVEAVIDAQLQQDRDRRALAAAQRKKEIEELQKAAYDDLNTTFTSIDTKADSHQKDRKSELARKATDKIQAQMSAWESEHEAMQKLAQQEAQKRERDQRQREEEERMLADQAAEKKRREALMMKELEQRQLRLAEEKRKLKEEKEKRDQQEQESLEAMKREMEQEDERMEQLKKYRQDLKFRREQERVRLEEEEKAILQQQLEAEIELVNKIVADKQKQVEEEARRDDEIRELREKRMQDRQDARVREAREKEMFHNKKATWDDTGLTPAEFERERRKLQRKREEEQRNRYEKRQVHKLEMIHNAKREREEHTREMEQEKSERDLLNGRRRAEIRYEVETAWDDLECARVFKSKITGYKLYYQDLLSHLSESSDEDEK